MSEPAYKSFSITKDGLLAKDWDGTTDRNGDGELTFAGDAKKNFEVTPSKVVYYDETTGAPSVTIDVNGTTLH